MSGLMLNELSFPKPVTIQLDKDPNTWQERIYGEFATKTKNDQRPNKLEIKKEEAESGALFGWVTIINDLDRERKMNDPYNRLGQEDQDQDQDEDTNLYFPIITSRYYIW